MSRLSWPHKIAYASGNAGVVLGMQLVATSLLALYLPPSSHGEARMPAFVFGLGSFLLVNVLARGIDTPFDPFIATLSDNSTHPWGRRRRFMALAVLPLAVFTALLFFPPFAGAAMGNLVFLGVALTAYFCLFSTYVAPYLALLPELAPDKHDNTVLSTLMAAAALVGGMVATVVAPPLFLSGTGDTRAALQTMALALSFVSFVLMLIPVLVIDERHVAKPATAASAHPGFIAAVAETFRERAFVPYVVGTNLFFFGFTVIQTAAPYYLEVLLHRPLSEQGAILGPLFGVAALTFPVIAAVTKRLGKRVPMVGASVGLALLCGVGIPALGPTSPAWAAPALFAACGVPVAMFLAVPNAILADICEAHAVRLGARREAVFFGAQGFLQKVALGIASGLVGWAVASGADPLWSVRATGPIAAVALLAAAACFWRYPEADVQRVALSGISAPPV